MDDVHQMELDLIFGVLDALPCPVALLNRVGRPAYCSARPCPVSLEDVDFAAIAEVTAALNTGTPSGARVTLSSPGAAADGLLEIFPVRVADGMVGALALFHPDDRTPSTALDALPTVSEAMSAIRARLQKLSMLDSATLFLGESGTGRESFARALHRLSPRRDDEFTVIGPDGTVDDLLLASERRGALFLRCVDAWPPELLEAAGLLLGVGTDQRLLTGSCRVMASASPDLARLAQEQRFPAGLFTRLNVLPVFIPALRDRPEDIEPMSLTLLRAFAPAAGKDIQGFSRHASEILRRYAWPGNAAELRAAVESAVGRCPGGLVLATHLPIAAQTATGALQQMKDAYTQEQIGALLTAYGTTVDAKRRVAAELGIGLSTLYRILAKRPHQHEGQPETTI